VLPEGGCESVISSGYDGLGRETLRTPTLDFATIVDTLQVVLPVAVLVDLVEDDDRAGWVVAFDCLEEVGVPEEARPVGDDVPVEVVAVRVVGGDAPREGRLAGLARADHEDHGLGGGEFMPGGHVEGPFDRATILQDIEKWPRPFFNGVKETLSPLRLDAGAGRTSDGAGPGPKGKRLPEVRVLF
jgi:hypothetical protein